MKTETSYRVIPAVLLSMALAVFIWYCRELSAIQIGCGLVMFLAVTVCLFSNPANNTIRIAAAFLSLLAGTTLMWTFSRHPSLKGMIIYGVFAITVAPLLFLRRPVSSNQGTDSCNKL